MVVAEAERWRTKFRLALEVGSKCGTLGPEDQLILSAAISHLGQLVQKAVLPESAEAVHSLAAANGILPKIKKINLQALG